MRTAKQFRRRPNVRPLHETVGIVLKPTKPSQPNPCHLALPPLHVSLAAFLTRK